MALSNSNRPRRVAALVGAVTVLCSAGALVAPAAPAEAPTSCREVTCATTISVGRKAVRWVSPEVFYPNNERLYAGLSGTKGDLTLIRSYGQGLCKSRWFGAGMTVVTSACGSSTPLRVRAVRLKKGFRSLTITYSASPNFDGTPASTGGTSASPADPLAQLLQPITGLLGL